jgi:hypothetical protein
LALTLLTVALTLAAQAGDPKDLLLKKLNEHFVPTTFSPKGPPSFRADTSQIVTAGVIVALKENGLLVYPANRPLAPVSVPKLGKLTQGFGDLYKARAADSGGDEIPSNVLLAGEKVWISSIWLARDSIQVQVVTDPYDDGRYSGTIKFLIPKDTVPTPEDAIKAISEVLEVQPPQDQGGPPAPVPSAAPPENKADQAAPPAPLIPPGGQAVSYILTGSNKHGRIDFIPGSFFSYNAPGRVHDSGQGAIHGDTLTLTYRSTGRSASFKIQGGTFVSENGEVWSYLGGGPPLSPAPEAAAAPVPEPAPTPAPAAAPAPAAYSDIAPPAAPAPTISLGQTTAQVAAVLGDPIRKAVLGAKEIYFYKDMKVTFTKGKVTDVQ